MLGVGPRALLYRLRCLLKRREVDVWYDAVDVHLSNCALIPAEVVSRLTASALAILDALRLAGQPLGTGQLAEMAGVTRMTCSRLKAKRGLKVHSMFFCRPDDRVGGPGFVGDGTGFPLEDPLVPGEPTFGNFFFEPPKMLQLCHFGHCFLGGT